MNKKIASLKLETLKVEPTKIELINSYKKDISLFQKWIKIIEDSTPEENNDVLIKLNEDFKESKIKFDSLIFAVDFMKTVIRIREKEINDFSVEHNPLSKFISKLQPFGITVIETSDGIKLICDKEAVISKLLASTVYDKKATNQRLNLNSFLGSQIEKLKPNEIFFDIKNVNLDFSNPEIVVNILNLIDNLKMSYSRAINNRNHVQIILSNTQKSRLTDNLLEAKSRNISLELLGYVNQDYPGE